MYLVGFQHRDSEGRVVSRQLVLPCLKRTLVWAYRASVGKGCGVAYFGSVLLAYYYHCCCCCCHIIVIEYIPPRVISRWGSPCGLCTSTQQVQRQTCTYTDRPEEKDARSNHLLPAPRAAPPPYMHHVCAKVSVRPQSQPKPQTQKPNLNR